MQKVKFTKPQVRLLCTMNEVYPESYPLTGDRLHTVHKLVEKGCVVRHEQGNFIDNSWDESFHLTKRGIFVASEQESRVRLTFYFEE